MSRDYVKVCQNICVILWILNAIVRDIECRQAIQPVEDVENIIKRLNPINLNDDIDTEGPPCSLNIQRDFPRKNAPQPLYIIPNTNQFWLPNEHGQVQIPRGAIIELYCAKSFANATQESISNRTISSKDNIQFSNVLKVAKNTRILRPRCLHDTTFLWQGEKYEFQQFACKQPATTKVERLLEKCPTMKDNQISVEAEMYRVGYNISADGRFLETMRICYDSAAVRTLYVQHVLLPANVHFQTSIKRLGFSEAGYFKNLNMNQLYTQTSQQKQAASLLQGHHKQFFDSNTLFLTRGHLAAKSDFIYGSQQRTTFTFFNIAPQWQSFNGGQWAALENEVRKFIAKSNLLVDCYTGTWGIMQLPLNANSTSNASLEYRDFYLTQDSNNNGLIPVPQLFYRVIVERPQQQQQQPQRGIVLVGVNNPHATLNEINASYVICEDIREQVPWLRWMRNKNLKKGFMYACQVADFVDAVGHLPKSLLNVTDILV